MSVLTFEQLVEKSYLKEIEVTISGLGKIKMMQVSLEDAREIVNKAQSLKGNQVAIDLHVTKTAARFVKGSDPTDDEVTKFSQHVTQSAVMEIYQKGLESSPDEMDLDGAEKN